MKVSVITFREEYLLTPRILAAFSNEDEAANICSVLNQRYREIKSTIKDKIRANEEWEKEMIKNRIPSNQRFQILDEKMYNFEFEVFEVELL